ncbi:MAG: Gfo/Idh/MocA family oxidoreductase [Pirellulales bacterium]|nr:Gfo/Idh/MocA family oxidoreductase [Pirellulales bacterium]
MSENPRGTTRRAFLKNTGRMAAATALAGAVVPHVHAAENNTLQVALVGCGGRGTGAAADALSATGGPIKLVAMADVFENRLSGSYERIKREFPEQVDAPADRRFVGFDGYKKAIDCLRPGDIVIFATPPAFRWPHFTYAIEKGVHVFMEKPVTVDGPTTRRMLKLADEAEKKNLKVAVGLMWRHCAARRELVQRVQQGEIGDIVSMRTYRMHGPIGSFSAGPKPQEISELLYQIQRFHSFLWLSGGAYSDFYIHNIDELCWMKGAWPVEAQAVGGRHYRGDSIDQNFDSYSVEYTFPDGTKLFMIGRCISGCYDQFGGFAHGSKGMGAISSMGDKRGTARIYKCHDPKNENLAWRYPPGEPSPYRLEWNEFVEAIRNDKPYNEARRGAEASLVSSMGRMAAHTGQIVTWDDLMNSNHEFAPEVDKLAMDSPAPLRLEPNGKYPVPQPGLVKDREY